MPSRILVTTATALATFAPLAQSSDPLHGRHPMITSFPELGKRQVQCLEPQVNTVCPDQVGCCPSGIDCTQVNEVPGCATTCATPAVLCAGPNSDLCCNAGSSCDPSNNGQCVETAPPTPVIDPSNTGRNPLFTAIPSELSGLLDGPGASDPTNLEIMPSFTDGGDTPTASEGDDATTTAGGESGGTGSAPSNTNAASPVALGGRGQGWENGLVQMVAGGLGVIAFLL